MACYFRTGIPKQLLQQFNARIDQTEPKGRINTWERSKDGKYYTHKSSDWANKAWFKPVVEENQLTFNIIKPQNQNITTTVYGYYHGHLTETFLNHFDNDFTTAQATALPTVDDHCSSKN